MEERLVVNLRSAVTDPYGVLERCATIDASTGF
jgi:hypothetical protein